MDQQPEIAVSFALAACPCGKCGTFSICLFDANREAIAIAPMSLEMAE